MGNLADVDTSAGVVAAVPLGQSVLDLLSDLTLVGEHVTEELDLPVGVVLCVLGPVLLEVLGLLGDLVLGVVLARVEVGTDAGSEGLDGSLNGVPVLGEDGLDEGIGVVSQVLVSGKALGHLVSDDGVGSLVDLGEHLSVELARGGGGNGSVLDGESGDGKHFKNKL